MSVSEKNGPVRVLIVDDSLSMCEFIKLSVESDDAMQVVGFAHDAFQARERIKSLNPDIITLDIEMPEMDGITFLRNLMRLRPMPVVMVSSLTTAGAALSLEALSVGAVDVIAKRVASSQEDVANFSADIARIIRNAASARMRSNNVISTLEDIKLAQASNLQAWLHRLEKAAPINEEVSTVVAIGASTGGPDAIMTTLKQLDLKRSAVCITQHMPTRFLGSFATRLDSNLRATVSLAAHGEVIKPGRCYVAPGDHHLTLRNLGGELVCELDDSPVVQGHKPSVDTMFKSLAKLKGRRMVALLLTGMGEDGANGMMAVKQAGGVTLVQDEESSVVWGMPRAAVKMDAANGVLPLSEIGTMTTQLL